MLAYRIIFESERTIPASFVLARWLIRACLNGPEFSSLKLLIVEPRGGIDMPDTRNKNQGQQGDKQEGQQGGSQQSLGRNPQDDRSAGERGGEQKGGQDSGEGGDGGSYKEGGQNEQTRR
jgi:hypothetical protein